MTQKLDIERLKTMWANLGIDDNVDISLANRPIKTLLEMTSLDYAMCEWEMILTDDVNNIAFQRGEMRTPENAVIAAETFNSWIAMVKAYINANNGDGATA